MPDGSWRCSEWFESAEDALDEVAACIAVSIIGPLSQTMTARRNHRLDSLQQTRLFIFMLMRGL